MEIVHWLTSDPEIKLLGGDTFSSYSGHTGTSAWEADQYPDEVLSAEESIVHTREGGPVFTIDQAGRMDQAEEVLLPQMKRSACFRFAAAFQRVQVFYLVNTCL